MARRPKQITVGSVAEALDTIAPPALAQDSDNVGLLAGDRAAPCARVLLCIDLTPPVLKEAVSAGCNLVLAYHPPLFQPVKRLLAESTGTDSLVHEAISTGVAIYSPHTALDAAEGGTNDVLASLCGLSDVSPLEFAEPQPAGFKVATFVPPAEVERVATAMFAAGAGRIGDYEQCSYRLDGEGTFFGTETTCPQLGRKGRLERVREVRIEIVAPQASLARVVAALRSSHPYEEPAFDIYQLRAAPVCGIARVGLLDKGTTLGGLARVLERKTKSRVVTIVGRANRRVRRAAVCVGAAGRLAWQRSGADVLVTGEIRHHDALTILRTGGSAVALGHFESERPVLVPLARRLSALVSGLSVRISRRDVGPFERLPRGEAKRK